jgi:hypothetical protein
VSRHGRGRSRGSGQFRHRPRNFPAAPIGAAGDLDRTTSGTMTMKIDAEQRAMLARMETAHAETARHLAVIERQIEARAERMTTSSRVKARQFGRASATWTRATSATFRRTSRRCALRGAARSTRCPQAGAAGRSHRGTPRSLPDQRTGRESVS